MQGLERGEWKPGELIPSELELAARFQVSQGTVRKAIDAAGYTGWIGCEYKPAGKTEDGLGWIKAVCGCGCKS